MEIIRKYFSEGGVGPQNRGQPADDFFLPDKRVHSSRMMSSGFRGKPLHEEAKRHNAKNG